MGSILQYLRPSLNYHLSFRSLFCLFLSGSFSRVLLYFHCILGFVWVSVCSVSLPRGAANRSMICDCGIFERKIKQSFKPVTVIV